MACLILAVGLVAAALLGDSVATASVTLPTPHGLIYRLGFLLLGLILMAMAATFHGLHWNPHTLAASLFIALCLASIVVWGSRTFEEDLKGYVTDVKAETVSSPAQDITYWAENTIDNDIRTAWNSAHRAGGIRPEDTQQCRSVQVLQLNEEPNSIGQQTLRWNFSQPVRIESFAFANGYQREAWVFEANHSIRDATVRVGGMEEGIGIVLEDVSGLQQFEAAELDRRLSRPTTFFEMTIRSIHCGTSVDRDGNPFRTAADVALTQVEFAGRLDR